MGIGDWGLGIGDWGFGDWGLGPIPNPQSPLFLHLILKSQKYKIKYIILFNLHKKINK